MSPKQKKTDGLITGAEIYDLIMRSIEPELLTTSVYDLAEKYKDETSAEHQERQDRYKIAFAEYDRRYPIFLNALHDGIHKARKQVSGAAEAKVREEEERQTQELLSQIASA